MRGPKKGQFRRSGVTVQSRSRQAANGIWRARRTNEFTSPSVTYLPDRERAMSPDKRFKQLEYRLEKVAVFSLAELKISPPPRKS